MKKIDAHSHIGSFGGWAGVAFTAEKLLEHKTDIEPEKLDWIFHSTACRAAVKAGDVTSPAEQRLFVEKLLSMPDIRYCPH